MKLKRSMKFPPNFDSFNARQLSPLEVAMTFIPSDNFSELLKKTHHVVIGPRGSGKTTLFKMLQLPALAAWSDRDRDLYLNSMEYITVFVPADISWSVQWRSYSKKLPNEYGRLIEESLFLTHTVRSFVESFTHTLNPTLRDGPLKKFAFTLSGSSEVELVKRLAHCLKIACSAPTLQSLEFSLRSRMADLGYYMNRVVADEQLPEFVFLDFSGILSAMIFSFNNAVNRPDQIWGFAFDELEIAPKAIRAKLFSLQRSTDQKILLKLSMSPYSKDFNMANEAVSPTAGNDFTPLYLWYAHKEDARPFCKLLFQRVCELFDVKDATPRDILGLSELDTENGEKSAYAVGSAHYKRLLSLSQKDPTFSEFLQRRGIDLDAIDKMDEDTRASKVRKIINIVTVRDEFLKEDGALRSRKNPALYAGAPTLFDLSEGNPRIFLGLLVPLVKRFAQTGVKVPPHEQSRAIQIVSNRSLAHLKNLPFTESGRSTAFTTIFDLIDDLGKFFFQKVILEPFSADPPTTFSVDIDMHGDVLEALGNALNAGAIVAMDVNPAKPLIEDMRGKRFRLNHLFGPEYRLPLVTSKDRKLSGIIARQLKNEQFKLQELFED